MCTILVPTYTMNSRLIFALIPCFSATKNYKAEFQYLMKKRRTLSVQPICATKIVDMFVDRRREWLHTKRIKKKQNRPNPRVSLEIVSFSSSSWFGFFTPAAVRDLAAELEGERLCVCVSLCEGERGKEEEEKRKKKREWRDRQLVVIIIFFFRKTCAMS